MKRRTQRHFLPAVDYWTIAICSVVLIGFSWVYMSSPDTIMFGDIVARVKTNEKVVALTFDDGPKPVHTERTLAILAENNVKATFFIIGNEAAKHPKDMVAITQSENAVGNHSYTHVMMAFMTPADVAKEIEKTDIIIRKAGYDGDIPFRAPYNVKFITLPWYLDATHRPDISRDVITAEGYSQSPQTIATDIVRQVRPGSIILLHPMYDHTATSRAAIPLIVDQLKANGYRFVTVPELLTYR